MAVMETVRHTGTVIHELHHVTTEVRLLIDTQSVGTSILWGQKRISNMFKPLPYFSETIMSRCIFQRYVCLTTGIILQERIQLLKPIHLW